MTKPVLFLDVDDTILGGKGPGRGAADFIRWCKQHFEVRWLTMWCPDGKLGQHNGTMLAKYLDMDVEELLEIENPHPFPVDAYHFSLPRNWRDKSVSVKAMLAETPDRPWVWVEDPHAVPVEHEFQVQHKDNYIMTDSSYDSEALIKTAAILAKRFNLPEMEAPPRG